MKSIIKCYLLTNLLIILSACTNPKEKIVDRQQEIKKDIELSSNLYQLFLTQSEDATKYANTGVDHFAVRDSLHKYENRLSSLRSEYDSLEIELKKY